MLVLGCVDASDSDRERSNILRENPLAATCDEAHFFQIFRDRFYKIYTLLTAPNFCRKCQNILQKSNSSFFAEILVKIFTRHDPAVQAHRRPPPAPPRGPPPRCGSARRRGRSAGQDTSLFSKLVLGCTVTKFCKQIRIFQPSSSSTRVVHFCTAPN